MRGSVGRRACRTGIALLAVALAVAVPGASGSTSRTTDNPRIFCGIEQGPTWKAGAVTGSTWYVAGLTTRSECKSAANWALILGKKITATAGAAVQAFRSGAYGCVVTRTSLEAACYLGNGGPGAVGVIVIGNPVHNVLIPTRIRLRLPLLPLPLPHAANPADDPQAGVPIPWIGGQTCTGGSSLAGPEWSFLLPDGTSVRGTHWTVESFDFFTSGDCSTMRDLWPAIAHAVDRSGQAPSTNASPLGNDRSWTWQQGGWGCVSARDYTVAAGVGAAAHGDVSPGDHTVGLPFAGCARTTFPNGTRNTDHTPALSSALEQIVVYPNIEVDTTGIPSAQTRPLQNRVIALRDSLAQYGITVVALAAITAQKLDQAPPHGTVIPSANPPSQWIARQACGGNYRGYWPSTSIASAPWTSGSSADSTWTLATAGGYPCELADPVFKVFLANLTSSSAGASLSAGQLHRHGWSCAPNRTTLITICRFAPELYLDVLRAGVGHEVPGSFRIGIAAAIPPSTERLAPVING
ncbi:MAG TPA: hypothetical protein VGM80_14185 [Gaiellaceae bacterium]